MRRARHLDVIGKLEPALKGAGGNAAMQIGFGLFILSLSFARSDDQRILSLLDGHVFG